MSTDPWALAVCLTCQPPMPQPFSYTERGQEATWAARHVDATGHAVALAHSCPECGHLVCLPTCPGQDTDHPPYHEPVRLAILRPGPAHDQRRRPRPGLPGR